MKKLYEQKIFLAAKIGGGREEVPTESGEVPMVSELEGGGEPLDHNARNCRKWAPWRGWT